MTRKKSKSEPAVAPSSAHRVTARRSVPALSPTVSGRWLLIAVSIAIVAAAVCAWATLCLLFWQGSWQLLYHPRSAVARTPASVGTDFESVGFAATEAGEPRLKGWWIAGKPESRFTAIYLHGADGDLGDTVDALVPLHNAGLNVFAFDYRGYGASRFERPSEARWREDAESAIEYLTNTRHVPAGSLILFGRGLGANLALEVAAAHPELAGLVMEEPLAAPADAIFGDPRAKLVPAHLLVSDRWDLAPPAATLRIPSLWFCRTHALNPATQKVGEAYGQVTARKVKVWLTGSPDAGKDYASALTRWLDDLPSQGSQSTLPAR
jgi:pimeloyl-ACP methyl ester carboxylesterase